MPAPIPYFIILGIKNAMVLAKLLFMFTNKTWDQTMRQHYNTIEK